MSGSISSTFQNVLGRAPSAYETSYWQSYLNSGGNLPALQSGLAHSAEAQGNIAADFQNELGRAANANDIAVWEAALTNGSASAASMRTSFSQLPEVTSAIQNTYAAVLARSANAAQVSYWQNYLTNGGSLPGIQSILAYTGESQGNIATDFQNELGRAANGADFAFWEAALANGSANFWTMRTSFAYSAEAQGNIAADFQNELGRAANANDLATWETALTNGTATAASMRTSFSQTTEAVTGIQNAYTAVLGRAADAPGLAYWQNYLVIGGSQAAVKRSLAYSSESQADIATDFQNEFGRTANGADYAFWEGALANGTATFASMRTSFATSAEAQSDIAADFQNELGRAATANDLAFWENRLASSADTFASMRTSFAQSAEATTAIQNAYTAVLGRSATATEVAYWQQNLIAGGSTAPIRGGLAKTDEAAADINTLFTAVLGQSATTAGLAVWENHLATDTSLADAGASIATTAVETLFRNDLGRDATLLDQAFWQSHLGTDTTLKSMRTALAQSADATNSIQTLYAAVLGRSASASEIGYWQTYLSNGGSLNDIRAGLPSSPEAAADINTIVVAAGGSDTDPASLATLEAALSAGATLASLSDVFAIADEAGHAAATAFYHTVLGRDPLPDEIVGIKAALAANIAPDTPIAVLDQQGNLLGQATADKLMVELPVFVTMNNGATPTLLLPGGTVLTDGAQVAACLLGLEGRAGRLDATAIAIYGQIMGWLDQIGQQLIQLATTVASWTPHETNSDRRAIDSEIVTLALQLAAMPPALRDQRIPLGGETTRISLSGHQTDVTVFFNGDTGQWTYGVHDIANNSVFSYVLQAVAIVATAVATYLSNGATAPLLAEEIATLTAVAVVADAALAVQDFTQGNDLGGLLSLAAAVGVGLQGAGSVFNLSAKEAANLSNIGKLVLAASQVVGGTASTIQGLETGNTLGIAGGLLEVAAGVAGGKVALEGDTASAALKTISFALNTAATATNISNAIAHGRIADALLASLGPLINSIAALTQSSGYQSAAVVPVTQENLPPLDDQTPVSPGTPAYLRLVKLVSTSLSSGGYVNDGSDSAPPPTNQTQPGGNYSLYVAVHPALFPSDPLYHGAIWIVNNDPYNGSVTTLGAQPSLRGNLIEKTNYIGDMLQVYSGAQLFPIQVPSGQTPTQFAASLIAAASSYQNNQGYFQFPVSGVPLYNSNSFVAGVIKAAGGLPPSLGPFSTPGYEVPLPLEPIKPSGINNPKNL